MPVVLDQTERTGKLAAVSDVLGGRSMMKALSMPVQLKPQTPVAFLMAGPKSLGDVKSSVPWEATGVFYVRGKSGLCEGDNVPVPIAPVGISMLSIRMYLSEYGIHRVVSFSIVAAWNAFRFQ